MKGEIAIIGAGCTAFGELFDRSYNDLLAEACREAFEQAGIKPRDVQAAWLGTAFPDVGVYKGRSGMDLAESLGLYGIPMTRVSNYCATGGDAIRNAANALLAGEVDVALAAGVEKQRDRQPQESIVKLMVDTGHPFYQKGFTAAGTFAVFANRHMETFDLTADDLADVSVKNHHHAVFNPKAFYRKEFDRKTVASSPMVATPLTLLECCPTTDGAAAVVLVRRRDLKRFPKARPVFIRGLGLVVGTGWDQPFHDPEFDFLSFPSVRQASEAAYRQAGISDPAKDIQVAEVHDCFSICELIASEDLQFCKKGEAAKILREGRTALGGALPINVSGGLLSCGHPIGATGIRMVYEIVQQIHGKADKRQVPDVRMGLTQNFGGPGSVAVVTVLSRE